MCRNPRQELWNPSQASVPADGVISCLEGGGGNTPHEATAATPSGAPAPPVPRADLLKAMAVPGLGATGRPALRVQQKAQPRPARPWSAKPELVTAVPEPLGSPREGGTRASTSFSVLARPLICAALGKPGT